MAPRRWIRIVVAGLCGTLLPAAGALAFVGFAAPARREVVTAGGTTPVNWSLAGLDGHEIEEMELLLSLDGGKTFPVRITRDLSPGTRSFAWRVPALPTEQARLALRTGEDGEETIAFISEEFTIAAGADLPLEPTKHVGDEWRTRDAFDGSAGESAPDPTALAGATGFIGSLPPLPPATAPKPTGATLEDSSHAVCPEAPHQPPSPAIPTPFSRVPTSAPMRE